MSPCLFSFSISALLTFGAREFFVAVGMGAVLSLIRCLAASLFSVQIPKMSLGFAKCSLGVGDKIAPDVNCCYQVFPYSKREVVMLYSVSGMNRFMPSDNHCGSSVENDRGLARLEA